MPTPDSPSYTDIVSREKRSQMMAGIKGRNTRPEMAVRKGLFRLGFRYRLHARNLPGIPDIVLPKYRAVVFVHGCFWHGHDCHLFKLPAANRDFWQRKIQRNRERDAEVRNQLQQAGWRICTVWECALRGRNRLPIDSVCEQIARWLRGRDGACEFSERTNSRTAQPV